MSEREVVEALDLLQLLLIIFALFIFVLQNLIGHDESISFVSLIFRFIMKLLTHQLALQLEKPLLILTLLDLFKQLSVALFMNLIDYLPEHVFVI